MSFLASKGIPIRTDNSERNHMHHKFALVDGAFLINGSFNWTAAAGKGNNENIMLVDHPFYMEKYQSYFNSLWLEFK